MVNNKWSSEGFPLPSNSELEFALASSGLAEDLVAAFAGDRALGMREDDLDVHALVALHIHEVGVGRLNEALQFVSAFFHTGIWVKEVDLQLPCLFLF